MATHTSILAWRIPRTEEPGRLQSIGSQRVRHDWAAKHNTTPLRRDLVCWQGYGVSIRAHLVVWLTSQLPELYFLFEKESLQSSHFLFPLWSQKSWGRSALNHPRACGSSRMDLCNRKRKWASYIAVYNFWSIYIKLALLCEEERRTVKQLHSGVQPSLFQILALSFAKTKHLCTTVMWEVAL